MTSPCNPEEDIGLFPTHDYAACSGLASLIMGAVLFLAAPITMILAVQVWQFADHSTGTVRLHAWLARVGVSIALLTSLTSIAFGVLGIRSMAKRRQSNVLSLAGIFLSLAALGLWIITAITTLHATESLLYLYG